MKISLRTMFACLFVFLIIMSHPVSAKEKQLIIDEADLLTDAEEAELADLALEYGEKHETDFMILTTNDTDGKDVKEYMGDFYDETAPGYDQPHGNTVLLTLDMENRDMYLSGFGKGEQYLSNDRIELVLDQIFPYIAEGNYYKGFHEYLTVSNDYMRYRPGVNPENPLYQWWVQLGVALVLAGVIVFFMAYHSGGKVTTTDRTYIDHENTKINRRRDVFVNKTVTKKRKPSNNNQGGGPRIGGGGGVTGGGRSFSGGRRSF